jgi:hypothetical protein
MLEHEKNLLKTKELKFIKTETEKDKEKRRILFTQYLINVKNRLKNNAQVPPTRTT